jgi:hypothetical protein
MSIRYSRLALQDNGGRRINIDRRQFSYTDYIPDRRSGNDRRSAMDRRSGPDQRSGEDRRVAFLTTNEHEYTRI